LGEAQRRGLPATDAGSGSDVGSESDVGKKFHKLEPEFVLFTQGIEPVWALLIHNLYNVVLYRFNIRNELLDSATGAGLGELNLLEASWSTA